MKKTIYWSYDKEMKEIKELRAELAKESCYESWKPSHDSDSAIIGIAIMYYLENLKERVIKARS